MTTPLIADVITGKDFDGLLALYTNLLDIVIKDTSVDETEEATTDAYYYDKLNDLNVRMRMQAAHVTETIRAGHRRELFEILLNLIDTKNGGAEFTVLDIVRHLSSNERDRIFFLLSKIYTLTLTEDGPYLSTLSCLDNAVRMMSEISIQSEETLSSPAVYRREYARADLGV